ncbi:MAG: hypothetical protein CL916_14425 [Deltaproteobacteria bacterium]|nr:hypothetical protein [Deltaproteobacteria bacterium]
MGEKTKMDVLRSFRGTIVDFHLLDETTLSLQYSSFFAGTPLFIEYAEIMNDFLEGEDLNGIADLKEIDMDTGRIVYRLETNYAMTELLARSPRSFSTKASIELLIKCTDILIITGYAASISGIENHGNLSFDTIWVNQSGNVQLVNYGMAQFDLLAYQRGDIEEPSASSCLFAPPERFGCTQEDPTSDIFSLGQILFSLLTRQYLYQGNTQEIIAQAKSGIPHTNLLQYNFPEPLIPIFQQCLNPNPYERFGDFDALHDALLEIDIDSLEGASLEEEITAFLKQKEKAPTLPVHNEEEELRRIEQAEARLLAEEERLKILAKEKEEKALHEEEIRKKQRAEEERIRKEKEEKEQLRLLEEEEQKILALEKKINTREAKPLAEDWQQKGEEFARNIRIKIDLLSQEYHQDHIFVMSLTTIEVDLLPFADEKNKDWFHRLQDLDARLTQEHRQAQIRQEEVRKAQKEEEERIQQEKEKKEQQKREREQERIRKEKEAQEEIVRQEREAEQQKLREEQERIRVETHAQEVSDSLIQTLKEAKQKHTNNRKYQRALAMIDVDRFQLDDESFQQWLKRLNLLKEKCRDLQEEAQSKAEEEKEHAKQNERKNHLFNVLEQEKLQDTFFEKFIQQSKEQVEKKAEESSKNWGVRLDAIENEFATQKKQALERIKEEKRRKEEREAVRQYAQGFCFSLDDLIEKYPNDEQLKRDCMGLKEEAQEPQSEESTWWRDKISDLETEREAFERMAKQRAENEKNRQEKLSVIRKESQRTIMKIDAFLQRYQDDLTFQNSLQALKEKAQTELFEPSEWQATLRYVEKDLDTHVEEAQERVIVLSL